MVFRAYFSPSPLSLFSDFLLFLFSFYRYRPPASTLYSSILSLIIVSLIFFPLLHLNQLLSNSALVIIYLSFFIAFNYLYSSLHLCPLIFVSQFPHPSIANITAMMITSEDKSLTFFIYLSIYLSGGSRLLTKVSPLSISIHLHGYLMAVFSLDQHDHR
ncbi:unnamed protein product [Acanthosepion pharaonis]|uniref:Uncharacterized protein n=1 Tax=Acanthosepion pharaonis TaxID=158019 RepID=A0A812BNR4_ACAPH|nr:unnamed protein product [Sepia pharaonis]